VSISDTPIRNRAHAINRNATQRRPDLRRSNPQYHAKKRFGMMHAFIASHENYFYSALFSDTMNN